MADCSICKERGITKNAIIWCSECDEKFCVECNEHHSTSKLTKRHNTRTIEEYQTLPSFILEMKQFCEEHEEKYQLFCKKHDCPCCRRCGLEKHKDCRDIMALEDIITNVKTSVSFQDIQNQLKEISENIAKITIDRKESMTSITQQRKQIEKDVAKMREIINEHLDRIQEKFINELVEAEGQTNLQIQNIITKLKKKEDEINELQSNMTNIQKYASDLQAFLSIKQIGATTMTYENYIQSLADDKNLTRTVISCKMDDTVQNVSSTMRTFGQIIVDVQPSKIQIGIKKHKQAQIMVAQLPTPSIDNVPVKLIKGFKAGCNNVRGCCVLPDGKMVFAPWDAGKLFILNKDGSFDFTMDFKRPCDVTCIDSDTIAVSTATFSDYINIVSLKKRIVERKIDVGTVVYGVTHKDGELFCCSRGKGLLRVCLKDSTSVTIANPSLSDWCYVTTYNNNIYFTGVESVTCCDMEGKTKWKLDSGLSRRMYGLSIDKSGRIFTIGGSKVFVISPDGKQHKEVITNLNQAQVLHCDRTSSTLLVATRGENLFLYNIANV